MTDIEKLIGWAAVEKSKALDSYLYQRDKLKNEIVAEGYVQRARAFDDIIKMSSHLHLKDDKKVTFKVSDLNIPFKRAKKW